MSETELNKEITAWLMELIEGLDGAGLIITDPDKIKSWLKHDEIDYKWGYIKSLIKGEQWKIISKQKKN